VVADEAKLAIVFTYFFLLLVQTCLRAPPVVVDEVKLAIVYTSNIYSCFTLQEKDGS